MALPHPPLGLPETEVIAIVLDNLARGRLERFVESRPASRRSTAAEYIDRVLSYVCREQARIAALERGDPIAWDNLRAFLARRGLHMLSRFPSSSDTHAEAIDFANEACLIIFDSAYPFDIAFEAWAGLILRNLILTKYTRSRDALDRPGCKESLEQPLGKDRETPASLGEILPDQRSLIPFERLETELVLRQAISQLRSSAQQQVILYTYFDGLADREIGQRLHRSPQAVYNLRNRALARLKKIMSRLNPQES